LKNGRLGPVLAGAVGTLLAAILIALAVPEMRLVLIVFGPGLILAGIAGLVLGRLGVPAPILLLLAIALVTVSPVILFWGACVFLSACL